MRAFLAAAVAVLLVPAFAARAQDPAPAADPAVKAALDTLGYAYEVTDDGDYKIVFEYEDKRTQLVFVGSAVETYGDQRIREVYAPAMQVDGAIPGPVANHLLEASNELKMGAWAKAGDYAVFVIKLDAGASAEVLDDAMEIAGVTADAMEAELTPGKDEF